MQDFMYIVKALADENRLRALYALKEKELCVCQIIELLALAPSTVSKHMAILRQAHLIEGRKQGRWMYYCLPGKSAKTEIQKAISWVLEALSKVPEILDDTRRLKKILKRYKQQTGCECK